MSVVTIPLGQSIKITGRFYDGSGQLKDPPSVIFLTRTPVGVDADYRLGESGAPISRESEGTYTVVFLPLVTGRWTYGLLSDLPSDDASQPAIEGYFDVLPSAFG